MIPSRSLALLNVRKQNQSIANLSKYRVLFKKKYNTIWNIQM